jgi:hypothetical protein
MARPCKVNDTYFVVIRRKGIDIFNGNIERMEILPVEGEYTAALRSRQCIGRADL